MINPRGGPWQACRTALVAARDEDARRYLTEALTRVGYQADLYADLEMITEHPQTAGRSFLILEESAGGMDAVRRFRDRGGLLPVIFLSSARPQAAIPEDPGGSVGHLSLPFTLRMLKEAIERVAG